MTAAAYPSEKARQLVSRFARAYFASLDPEVNEDWEPRADREYKARTALLSYLGDRERRVAELEAELKTVNGHV